MTKNFNRVSKPEKKNFLKLLGSKKFFLMDFFFGSTAELLEDVGVKHSKFSF